MNNYLANAFSLQMLWPEGADVSIRRVPAVDVPADTVSFIGHPDTAHVVGEILGREVECHRGSLVLTESDVLYVAQLTGGRLPEGVTTLPEGFSLCFYKVTATPV